ncbi:MAG: hypothetical protein QM820_03535 [Minicystis sp.]
MNQISAHAHTLGSSSDGVCGDATGAGVAEGFEHACEVFRQTCDFDLTACSGDTALIAAKLVSVDTAGQ